MSFSPFASPKRALSFAAVAVLGCVFVADSVEDVAVEPNGADPQVVSGETTDGNSASPLAAATLSTDWGSDGPRDEQPSVDIVEYRPQSAPQIVQAAPEDAQFTGRRPIPQIDDEIVR